MQAARLDDLDTPCLTVDLDVFEANVDLCMERLCRVQVRPHLKTAKSPAVAELLLRAGAVGICVAKLSEAEVMLAGGIDDVLITTELAGPIKARRLADVRKRWPGARLRLVVDSWEGASAIDAALTDPIEVLIDVNVAQDRCGVAPAEALALADRVASSSAWRSSAYRAMKAISSTFGTRASGGSCVIGRWSAWPGRSAISGAAAIRSRS